MKPPIMKVIVILSNRFEAPSIWRLEVPIIEGRGVKDAANLVFKISNAPHEFLSEVEREILANFPRTGMRSVSVGDILIIEHALVKHVLFVDDFGFEMIE